MCGLAGVLGSPDRTEDLAAITRKMAATLRHRGPDDEDVWLDAERAIALGHTRLAILDLSPLGHQPMASHDGRYVIAYNGEIYNFARLREELEGAGHTFRGHSDTEVMLAAVQEWGIEGAVGRFNGMFAFALWDRAEHELTLARDRVGEKPLYYAAVGGEVIFASELKALRAHPRCPSTVDRDALAALLRYGYVPGPGSIHTGVHKLPPGCLLTLRPGAVAGAQPRPYWSLADATAAPRHDGDEDLEALHELLLDAVRIRMVADVPVGAFLSGGVDSSLVTALMQAGATAPVRTYAIGFAELGFNEAPHARAVAEHLGTEHTEFSVRGEDMLDLIPSLSHVYDEPFADPSQLPTMLVSALARQHVTVALSGDGGDELFGGYRRYGWAQRMWRATGWMPPALRRAVGAGLAAPRPDTWDRVSRYARSAGLGADPRLGERVGKAAEVIAARDFEDLYRRMMSQWKDPATLVAGAREEGVGLAGVAVPDGLTDPLDRMSFADARTYLPDDILVKVDRAGMAVSLEGRIPLLDHRVVEYAWRLPASAKVRDGRTKWPLRALLDRYVPRDLIERPKQGFDIPLADWLRGPLRGWADDLLSPALLERQGHLRSAPIAEKWAEHRSGRRDWHLELWNVLAFQSWLQADGTAPPPEPAAGRALSCR